MTRSEIIQMARDEVPEIDTRAVSDTLAQNWCQEGDKDFCARTRCIVDHEGTTITTAENEYYWDLESEIMGFYDIDESPGGGVLYNNVPLEKTTIAELDAETDGAWRDYSSGTPEKWFRHGKYLHVERAIDSNTYDLLIYSVLNSDDWDSDVAPYNQLTHLTPYHYGMVKYLVWKMKSKISKREAASDALQEYVAYTEWVKLQLGGNKYGPINLVPQVRT